MDRIVSNFIRIFFLLGKKKMMTKHKVQNFFIWDIGLKPKARKWTGEKKNWDLYWDWEFNIFMHFVLIFANPFFLSVCMNESWTRWTSVVFESFFYRLEAIWSLYVYDIHNHKKLMWWWSYKFINYQHTIILKDVKKSLGFFHWRSIDMPRFSRGSGLSFVCSPISFVCGIVASSGSCISKRSTLVG